MSACQQNVDSFSKYLPCDMEQSSELAYSRLCLAMICVQIFVVGLKHVLSIVARWRYRMMQRLLCSRAVRHERIKSFVLFVAENRAVCNS